MTRDALRTYLRSRKHLVGVLLAVAGPVLALLGVVSAAAGAVVAVLLYGVGAFATPPAVPPSSAMPRSRPKDVQRALDELLWRSAGRVPAATHRRMVGIATVIRETLPLVRASSTSAADEYVLVQCAVDYLPTAVDAYMRLPPNYAGGHDVVEGKTPQMLLAEQVELLEREVRAVAANVHRAETDTLIVNWRFLHEKFRSGRLGG